MRGFSRPCGARLASVSRSVRKNSASRCAWHSRRRLRLVGDHTQLALGRAHQIGGVEVQEAAAGRRYPGARPQQARVRQQHLRRHQPFAQHPSRAVQIGEQPVEQRRPLRQPSSQVAELLGRQQNGDRIERPRPFQPARVTVDVERDAVLADELPRLLPAPPHLPGPERAQRTVQHLPVRPHRPILAVHFVPSNGRHLS